MKEFVAKYLHIFIVLYAFWDLYGIFLESEERLEMEKTALEGQRSQLNAVEQKLKKITEFKKNLAESQRRVDEVLKQIEKTQQQLPTEINETVVARELDELATDLMMKNVNVIPKEEKREGFYFRKTYTVQTDGTFLQAVVFFENLMRSKRILNVENFTLEQKETGSRSKFKVLSFSADIESYRYNQDFKEEGETPSKNI